VLPSTLGRYIHCGTLEQLQQGLLYTFTTHIPRDRGIIGLTGDLVNLIDVYNASLCSFGIVISRLEQAGKDTFNIFTNVAGLRQYGCISDTEWHLKNLGQCACEICLTRSGFTSHDDVGFFNLDITYF
jgi:hypothetical protein